MNLMTSKAKNENVLLFFFMFTNVLFDEIVIEHENAGPKIS